MYTSGSQAMTTSGTKAFSTSWRLVGFVPLFFFISRLMYFSVHGGTSQILWMCHFSNLTLALGLLFNFPVFVGISAYWLTLAIPFWIIDVIGFGMEGLTSLATHAGGTIIALAALSRIHPPRRIWVYALTWYLFLQAISRFFTPPELNINAAHAVYRGWESFFNNYFFYWLLVSLSAGLALYLLDLITVFLHKEFRKAGRHEISHLD